MPPDRLRVTLCLAGISSSVRKRDHLKLTPEEILDI